MNHHEINSQLENLLLNDKDKRKIKNVKLNSENLKNIELVDNLYAANQFLVRDQHSKIETVVNYNEVHDIEIELELVK